MRGFLVSFAGHAGALAALLSLPVFSGSELPPVHARDVVIYEPAVPRPVVSLRRPAPPSRAPRAGGGAVEAPARRTAPPVVSDAPLAPTIEDPAEEPELETGFGIPPLPRGGTGDGPGSGDGSGDGTQSGPALVRVETLLQPPRKLSGRSPVYPPMAIATRTAAVVQIECVIDVDGRVRELRVIRGHPLFDPAALDAVRSWSYTPTLLNGVPVAVLMTVTVNFTLTTR